MTEFDRAAAERAALRYEMGCPDPNQAMSRLLRAALAEIDRLAAENAVLASQLATVTKNLSTASDYGEQAAADRDRLAAENARFRADVHDCPVCGRACKQCECTERELARLRAALATAAVPLETLHTGERDNQTLCPELHAAIADAVTAIRSAARDAARADMEGSK